MALRSFSASVEAAASPAMPIGTAADVSTLCVHADVGETDVGRIMFGQGAYITADAYGSEKFCGRVIRIRQMAYSRADV